MIEVEREDKEFAEIAQTFHRKDLNCSQTVDQECDCYDEYFLNKFNVTVEHTKRTGSEILDNIAFSPDNLLRNYLVMFAIGIVLRLLTFAVMKYKFRATNR